jgi:triosephosphate isomerase
MYKGLVIKAPFFEIGPKAYIWGKEALDLAKAIDDASRRYDVRIIYTPQYTEIPVISAAVTETLVFAQHMDPVSPGRGIGAVLPEAIRAAGARGVLLNHAEKKMSLHDICLAVRRADETGLVSMVCADNPAEAAAVAQFAPNIILAEPEALIGKEQGDALNRGWVAEITRKIREINPDIQVLHSAGIRSGRDVYDIMMLGADATGCTSGIICAENREKALDEMICNVRKGYDDYRRGAYNSAP